MGYFSQHIPKDHKEAMTKAEGIKRALMKMKPPKKGEYIDVSKGRALKKAASKNPKGYPWGLKVNKISKKDYEAMKK